VKHVKSLIVKTVEFNVTSVRKSIAINVYINKSSQIALYVRKSIVYLVQKHWKFAQHVRKKYVEIAGMDVLNARIFTVKHVKINAQDVWMLCAKSVAIRVLVIRLTFVKNVCLIVKQFQNTNVFIG